MKKLLSIAIALAISLSMLMAAPVAAAGSLVVIVDEPLVGEQTDWLITFSIEAAMTPGDDYIDIYFPVGTDLTTVPATLNFDFGATRALAIVEPFAYLGHGYATIALNQVRIYPPVNIPAGSFVALEFVNVINPTTSCFKTITVVQSNCCTTVSDPFPIYSLKIELVPGKNLISLPAYPEDTSIEVVLADLFAKAALPVTAPAVPFAFSVWYWDSVAQDWVIYASDTSFSDLQTMEAGKAYWVKVNAAIDFYFKGEPYPECQGPPQKWCYPASWSMIGITGADDMWASEFLRNATLPWPNQQQYAVSTIFYFESNLSPLIDGDYMDTGWFPGLITDPTWQQGVVHAVYDDAVLEPGVGYFMSFLGEACIIPPLP